MPLSEERRKQLDGIVSQMEANSEKEDDIHFVVDDFKKKYENEAGAEPSFASKAASAILPSINEAAPASVPDIGFGQYAGMNGKTNVTQRAPNMGERATLATAKAAGDIMELPKRALGAATKQAKPNDKGYWGGFVERMADPESGLGLKVRQAIQNSDQNAAAKIIESIGVGIVEDPLSWLTAGQTAFKIAKANGQAVSKASSAISAGKDLAEASAMKGGRKGSAGAVEGIPFTKTQQASLSGEEITPSLERAAKAEGEIKVRNKAVWDEFQQEQNAALNSKVGAVKSKNSFNDELPKDAGESVIGKIDDSFEAQKVVYKAKYETLEKQMAEAAPTENPALADAKSAMDETGAYPVEKDFDAVGNAVKRPKFTTTKVVDRKAKVLSETPQERTVSVNGHGPTPGFKYTEPVTDEAGKQIVKLGTKEVPTVEFITKEYYAPKGIRSDGMSDVASDAIMDARKLVEADESYASIKAARSRIGSHIGAIYDASTRSRYGTSDLGKLRLVYKKLSAAMEKRIHSVGGDAAVKEWTIADKMMNDRGDFAKLRRFLGTGKGEGYASVPGEEAVRRLTNSSNPKGVVELLRIKKMEADGVLPDGITKNLQNARFNDMIEKSTVTVNGKSVVDGKLFMEQANKIPPTMYNELWTADQADDIAQLVREGMAVKLAGKMKVIAANPNAASKLMRDAGGDIGIWAMVVGGPKGWLTMKAGRWLQEAAVSRGDRSAARYLRQFDKQSVTAGLFRSAAQNSLPLQTAEALVNPGQGQPTPSQEPPSP